MPKRKRKPGTQITNADRRSVEKLLGNGERKENHPTEIARRTGVGEASIYRIWREMQEEKKRLLKEIYGTEEDAEAAKDGAA